MSHGQQPIVHFKGVPAHFQAPVGCAELITWPGFLLWVREVGWQTGCGKTLEKTNAGKAGTKSSLVGKGSQGAGLFVAWLPHARGVEFTESQNH